MVRADDAHKSTNEAEKNTLIQQNFVEKLKFWKLRDEDEHEPARLTAMPSCLMHWWTPVLFAFILLAGGLLSGIDLAHATPTPLMGKNQPILAPFMAI